MKSVVLQRKLTTLIDQQRVLVETFMLDNFDCSNECQRVAIIRAINELQARVNGIIKEDMKPLG
jgi:hypothetical protein